MGMLSTRPAETLQAAVGTILGAVAIVVGATDDGLDLTDLANLEVQGAIAVLLGYVAAVRTYFVARRQRDPQEPVGSADDGTVIPTEPGP